MEPAVALILFALTFILLTASLIYSILTLVNINVNYAKLNKARILSIAGVTLIGLAWLFTFASIFVIYRSARLGMRSIAAITLTVFALLFALSGAILMVIVSTQLNKMLLRNLYVTALSSSIFTFVAVIVIIGQLVYILL